jgi:hypothetical protein
LYILTLFDRFFKFLGVSQINCRYQIAGTPLTGMSGIYLKKQLFVPTYKKSIDIAIV